MRHICFTLVTAFANEKGRHFYFTGETIFQLIFQPFSYYFQNTWHQNIIWYSEREQTMEYYLLVILKYLMSQKKMWDWYFMSALSYSLAIFRLSMIIQCDRWYNAIIMIFYLWSKCITIWRQSDYIQHLHSHLLVKAHFHDERVNAHTYLSTSTAIPKMKYEPCDLFHLKLFHSQI